MNETGKGIRNSELWSHNLTGWETPEVVGKRSGETEKVHIRPFDLSKLPYVRKQGKEADAASGKGSHDSRGYARGKVLPQPGVNIYNIPRAVTTLLPSVMIAKGRLNTRNYCPQRFVNPIL